MKLVHMVVNALDGLARLGHRVAKNSVPSRRIGNPGNGRWVYASGWGTIATWAMMDALQGLTPEKTAHYCSLAFEELLGRKPDMVGVMSSGAVILGPLRTRAEDDMDFGGTMETVVHARYALFGDDFVDKFIPMRDLVLPRSEERGS